MEGFRRRAARGGSEYMREGEKETKVRSARERDGERRRERKRLPIDPPFLSTATK